MNATPPTSPPGPPQTAEQINLPQMGQVHVRLYEEFHRLNERTNGWLLFVLLLIVFVAAALRFGRRQ